MKAKYKLILGRRKDYPLNVELEIYKGADCRVFLATGVSLENVKQWDASRQLVIKHGNADQYNMFLRGIIESIEAAEKDADNHGREFDSAAIRAAAKNLTSFENVDIVETFRKYVEEEVCKPNTHKVHLHFVSVLDKFVKTFKSSKNARMSFGEFNYSMLVEFDKFLTANYASASVFYCHTLVRKMIVRAKKDGLTRNNPYIDFHFENGKSQRRNSLTTEQLAQLENLDRKYLKENHINPMILDMYLFSCYTGLRFSDVVTLQKSEIHHDEKGLVVEKKTIKTGIRVLLPLYVLFKGKAQTIAEKYIEEHEDIETLFPVRGNTAANLNLKRLEKLLKLPIHITFHTARHTCASQLAERADNPFVIMDVLGHADIQTSMHYIHHSQKTSEKKLAEIDWSDTEDVNYLSNEDTSSIFNNIVETCSSKQLNSALTSVAIGAAMCNTDKASTIQEWIKGLKKTDYTIEAFGKRLEMLVG